jgi:hypothetical protein
VFEDETNSPFFVALIDSSLTFFLVLIEKAIFCVDGSGSQLKSLLESRNLIEF